MIESQIKNFVFLGKKNINLFRVAFSYKKSFGASFKATVKLNIFYNHPLIYGP